MSYHVYIARPEFKTSPILQSEWIDIASSIPTLQVHSVRNRHGKTHYRVSLASAPNKQLWLLPNGLIEAQDPTESVIAAMFEVAPRLGAAVYSEKLKRFESVQDWEERTRSYRIDRARKRAEYRKVQRRQRILKALLFLLAIVVGSATGWFFGGRNAV